MKTVHILFPGAKVWPIYSWHKIGVLQSHYWLGKPVRLKRAVKVHMNFALQEVNTIISIEVDKQITKLPGWPHLRIGFLNHITEGNNGVRALGMVYSVESIKYNVSKRNNRR